MVDFKFRINKNNFKGFSFKGLNTMRNQMLLAFLTGMSIVLLIVGVVIFHLVTDILKENAESEIKQTSVEMLARVDSQYEMIETLTNQVATSQGVQGILNAYLQNEQISFDRRQLVMQGVQSFQAYSNGIDSYELYFTDQRRVFPLSDLLLSSRIEPEFIERAKEANGRVVWAGIDERNPEYFLTIKKVNLLDRFFSDGGYLITRIHRDYFSVTHAQDSERIIYLTDNMDRLIYSNDPDAQGITQFTSQEVTLSEENYLRVSEESRETGWSLVIYTPVESLLTGISGIGTAILLAAMIGFILFSLVSYFISTWMTKPLAKLTRAMQFGRLGGLKESHTGSSTTEINDLTKTYNQMVMTMNDLIKVVYEKEITESRAELKALQAQINPHFLYNTLEALYWSLDEHGEDELADAVISMAALFRYTISDLKDQDWMEIKSEMEHTERYLKLMKLRLGNDLKWRVDLPKSEENIMVPKLIIQPIVENAVMHGLVKKERSGQINISVRHTEDNQFTEITIQDDGVGMDEAQLNALLEEETISLSKNGAGLAVANIRKRLELAYSLPSNQLFTIESEVGVGTTVTIFIPQHLGGNLI